MTTLLDHRGNPIQSAARPAPGGRWGRRRWESAETDRLNEAHWSRVQDQPINADLGGRLQTLRARSEYEAANNPVIAGMIATHLTDVVGSRGPTLQVLTGRGPGDRQAGREYARRLEETWEDWWSLPDVNGELGGADLMQLWVRQLWTSGEYLTQILSDPSADGPVSVRLNTIHPRRLGTPLDRITDPKVVLGVRRTKTGKPITYYVDERPEMDPLSGLASDYTARSARNIIHGFRPEEPGQARGVPWLASVLQTVADLRDYDAQVLDAARAAADYCIIFAANDPGTEPYEVDGANPVPIERRQQLHAPPGWTPHQMRAEQPSTKYVDFREERMRDIGRPVGMPLMMVRLDSQNHNYSSARFDGQIYRRTNEMLQAWIERHTLNRLVRLVEREASLNGKLPSRPPRVRFRWVWPAMPHVDPVKEATAEKVRMANRTLTLSDALAAQGKDFDQHIEQLRREEEALRSAGLLDEEAKTANRTLSAGALYRRLSAAAEPASNGNGSRH